MQGDLDDDFIVLVFYDGLYIALIFEKLVVLHLGIIQDPFTVWIF
jgi:hypothetical protein